jgi:two-component system OmpR family sensor kinase/two-component system sensor histidine kinase QseC
MALSLRDQGSITADESAVLAEEQFDFVVQIWGVDGSSVYVSRGQAHLPPRAVLGFADVDVNGRRWRVFSAATRDRVIQVAQPHEIRRQLAADAAIRAVLPLLAIAPLLAVAIWWFVGTSLAPLRRVASDVGLRDASSLAGIAVRDAPAEVAPLVASLNGLLDRLRAAFETQRAFVADAAHELRSPLTALKLQLQAVRRASDEDARRAAVDALAAGIERATRLVEQLLTLARSDPAAGTASFSEVDLVETVRLAVADVVPIAVARAVTLELSADPRVTLRGDAAALRVLARNLVDNAVRYSPNGARVEVQVRAAPGGALVQIDDSGPGIPADERERVFDRFYRREAGDESGSGLGLAIVKTIAEQHGARAALADSPLGGLRATVRFAA